MNPDVAARLQRLEIDWFATDKGYCMFTRANCAAVAHQQPAGLSLGSAGLMTENGFAYLVWCEDGPVLVAHGGVETAATAEQVDAIRRFSADLKTALK